jgi:hypothetical protein
MKSRNEGKIVAVISCMTPLTIVSLDYWQDEGPGVIYRPIVAILFRDKDPNWLNPATEYSTDYERFNPHPGTHRTSEEGPCECNRRGDRRCTQFGIFAKTPEELKADPLLTDDINRRITHLIQVAAADAGKKLKQREKSRIYQQNAKAKKLAKEAAAAGEYERLEPERLRVGASDVGTRSRMSLEYHTCGKPLARSLEELETFKAAPVTWEFEGDRWYCDCGTITVA